jgi:hypothetical protein
MRMKTQIILSGIWFALVSTLGCTPPQILVAQGFAGDRVVRYTIQQVPQAGDDDKNLFDLRVRLCNQGEDASDQDCKDSMLLQNVAPESVYYRGAPP